MALLCVGLSIFSFVSRAQQQRRVIKQKAWQDEPVKVTLLKVKGHSIKLNQDFDEDEDWLHGLTISITNTSDKPITYLSFRIDFPSHEGNSRDNPIPAYDFSYGHNPDSVNAILSNDTKPIMPKETKDFTISDDKYAIINELLRQSGYPAIIKRLDIVLDDIGFADNTLWRAGKIHGRDPNNPSKWIRINKTVGNLSKPKIRAPGYSNHSQVKGSGFSYMPGMEIINISAQHNMIPITPTTAEAVAV